MYENGLYEMKFTRAKESNTVSSLILLWACTHETCLIVMNGIICTGALLLLSKIILNAHRSVGLHLSFLPSPLLSKKRRMEQDTLLKKDNICNNALDTLYACNKESWGKTASTIIIYSEEGCVRFYFTISTWNTQNAKGITQQGIASFLCVGLMKCYSAKKKTPFGIT